MNYPSWDIFNSKYSQNKRDYFEHLCRLLFKRRYNLEGGLFAFYNNAGNETSPIQVGEDVIGFQVKHFDKEIGKMEIIESLQTAKRRYPEQTKVILFVNYEFGNPPKGHKMTAKQKAIIDSATAIGLSIEWMFPKDITDEVIKYPWIYETFFCNEGNFDKIDEDIKNYNDLYLRNIETSIHFRDNDISIDSSPLITSLNKKIADGENVIISGEPGCGKTAIIKRLFQSERNHFPIIIIKSSQLGASNVDDFFSYRNSHKLVEITNFYASDLKKIIVIDSAERLLDIKSSNTIVLFFDTLLKEGWHFIFTIRSAFENLVLELLECTFHITCSRLCVSIPDKTEIDKISIRNSFLMPSNERLAELLRVPFYLSLYLKHYDDMATTSSIHQFCDKVWDSITHNKGCGNIDLCLIDLAKKRSNSGLLYVEKDMQFAEAAEVLKEDGIISEHELYGYYFSHDIYEEFALDHYLQSVWYKTQNPSSFLERIGNSLPIRRAFRQWLIEDIANATGNDKPFVECIFNNTIEPIWIDDVLISILQSNNTEVFFNKYDKELSDNNFSLFSRIVFLLQVSCNRINKFITWNQFVIPVLESHGSGWDSVIRYAAKHVQDYYHDHFIQFYKILYDYSRGNRERFALAEAGELVLYPFNMMDEDGLNYITEFDGKTWANLVCDYSPVLKKELIDIIEKTINNGIDNIENSSYREVIFQLLDAKNSISLSIVIPKSIMRLADFVWCAGEERIRIKIKNEEWIGLHISDEKCISIEKAFGLSKYVDKWFFASPFQTPVYWLLTQKPKTGLEWLVAFIDKSVNCYYQKVEMKDISDIQWNSKDGSKRILLASIDLWNMYRTTTSSNTPCLLRSIHMALEKYLLDLASKKNRSNTDIVGYLLDYILDNAVSVSLFAVVSSIVTAYPDIYREQAIRLMHIIYFFIFDNERRNMEQYISSSVNVFYATHPDEYKAVTELSGLPHRKDSLETICLYYQKDVIIAEGKDYSSIQDVTGAITDLKESVNSLKGSLKNTAEFIIARIDTSSMNRETLKYNGLDAIVVSPVLTSAQKKLQAAAQNQARESMRFLDLSVWSDCSFKGKEKLESCQKYDNNVQTVLDDIQILVQELKSNYMRMPGDNHLPAKASSVLLIINYKELSEEQILFCKKLVENEMELFSCHMIDGMPPIKECLTALMVLAKTFPNEIDRYSRWLSICLLSDGTFGGETSCALVANILLENNIWNNNRPFAEKILQYVINSKTLDVVRQTAIFCIVPQSPINKSHSDLVAESLRVLENHYLFNMGYIRHYNIKMCFYDFLVKRLFVPENLILDIFINDISSNNTNPKELSLLLSCIIAEEDSINKPDVFWKIWEKLYKPVCNVILSNPRETELLRTFLLSSDLFQIDNIDWPTIRKQDMAFFKKIADTLGENHEMLHAISKVFCSVANRYYAESVDIINCIIARQKKLSIDADTTMFIEDIIKRYIYNYGGIINNSKMVKSKIVAILDFLIERGSPKAFLLKDGIL